MTFRKITGFTGSIPNKFIHNHLPKCPMCCQDTGWEMDQKIGLMNSHYFFRCEKCLAIMSVPVNDIARVNTTLMLVKKVSGRKVLTPYFKVTDVGNMQTTQLHLNQEYELNQLKSMANNNSALL